MKILFNHTEASTINEASHLLLEIGSYGISCLWYSLQPLTVRGVRMYHFNDHASGAEVSTHLKNLLGEPEFRQKLTYICLNQKESMIIPSAYFSHSHLDAMMDLVYGKDSGKICTDTIANSQVLGDHLGYNAYRVHPDILTLIETNFPGATVKHSSSLQLQEQRASTALNAIVYHHNMKLMLFDGNRLRLIQQFSYKTPSDAAYLLLNACHQHGLNPGDVSLILSGIIDKDSNLYREIIKYFLEVQLEPVQQEILLQGDLAEVSPHYFSHLTYLLTCVS